MADSVDSGSDLSVPVFRIFTIFSVFCLQTLELMLLVVKLTLTAVPLGLFVHVMTRFLQEAVHMEPADVLIPTPTRMASV